MELASKLGVTRVAKHDKYLGLPIEVSYSKEEAFGYVKEKIEKRARGWREKNIEYCGKGSFDKSGATKYSKLCDELFQVTETLV